MYECYSDVKDLQMSPVESMLQVLAIEFVAFAIEFITLAPVGNLIRHFGYWIHPVGYWVCCFGMKILPS